MQNRQHHRREVCAFLERHLSIRSALVSLPPGSGMETYFVEGAGRDYYVKVGASPDRYLSLAGAGLAPPVLACGQLEDGSPLIVQPRVRGRTPSPRDFQERLEHVAGCLRLLHEDPGIRAILPPASSNSHRQAGLRALDRLRRKWERYRARLPDVVEFVDASLDDLARRIDDFSTEGLAASHGDICNANWLFADDGRIYLADLESMALDDRALDLGALLWWYYPAGLRRRFLEVAGCRDDEELRHRMRVRCTMHCLEITLPRAASFDRFDPSHYAEALEDFWASLAGRENPKGYGC